MDKNVKAPSLLVWEKKSFNPVKVKQLVFWQMNPGNFSSHRKLS
jgi:hypothetical protein